MTSQARSVLISKIAHEIPLIYLFNQWLEFTMYYFALLWFEIMALEVWLHLYCYWVGNYLVSVIRFMGLVKVWGGYIIFFA